MGVANNPLHRLADREGLPPRGRGGWRSPIKAMRSKSGSSAGGRVGGIVAGHCDVTDTATLDGVFAELAMRWGKLDFVVHAIAFSDKAQLDGRYIDTTADNFSQTLLISCYSLTAVAQRAERLMPTAARS